MNKKAARREMRDKIRARLEFIASQAVQAQRMSVYNDDLCDRLDDIDNDLQAVIALVNRVRQDEVGGEV